MGLRVAILVGQLIKQDRLTGFFLALFELLFADCEVWGWTAADGARC
jgi:hypothetical protein